MRFTLSFRALENVSNAMAEGNNIIDFLASEGYLRWGEHCEITSRRLYSIYCEWCQDNVVTPLSAASFSSWMKGSAGEYCLRYSHRIPAETAGKSGASGASGRPPGCERMRLI